MTLLESTWNRKFWERMSATPDGCWLWLGKLNSYGYGITSRGGRGLMAHRVAYEQRVGPIPPALVLDHLCRTRACCNPQHLEPVTIGENVRRGDAQVVALAAPRATPTTQRTPTRLRPGDAPVALATAHGNENERKHERPVPSAAWKGRRDD